MAKSFRQRIADVLNESMSIDVIVGVVLIRCMGEGWEVCLACEYSCA